MNKKCISALLILLILIYPCNSWAAAGQAQPAQTLQAEAELDLPAGEAAVAPSDTIALSANPWLAELDPQEKPLPVGLGGIQIRPGMWLLSVPVSGLGQLVMGDPIRGLLFFLVSPALLLLLILGPSFVSNVAQGFGSANQSATSFSTQAVAVVGGIEYWLPLLAVAGIWIWNIVDAYLMNERLLSADANAPDQSSQALQKPLAVLMAAAESTRLEIGPDGAFLNHRFVRF